MSTNGPATPSAGQYGAPPPQLALSKASLPSPSSSQPSLALLSGEAIQRFGHNAQRRMERLSLMANGAVDALNKRNGLDESGEERLKAVLSALETYSVKLNDELDSHAARMRTVYERLDPCKREEARRASLAEVHKAEDGAPAADEGEKDADNGQQEELKLSVPSNYQSS